MVHRGDRHLADRLAGTVSGTFIDNLKIMPDVDTAKVTVVMEVNGETEGLSYHANARASDFSVSAASTENKIVLDILDQKLWSTGFSPFSMT